MGLFKSKIVGTFKMFLIKRYVEAWDRGHDAGWNEALMNVGRIPSEKLFGVEYIRLEDVRNLIKR